MDTALGLGTEPSHMPIWDGGVQRGVTETRQPPRAEGLRLQCGMVARVGREVGGDLLLRAQEHLSHRELLADPV